MNVLQNLTTFYNQLPTDSTYKNVCRGILEHMDEAAEGTIYDIAELTNSSRTTIWRMVQKMGYASFSDFHHELKRAVKQYTYYNRILPAEDCETAKQVKESLLQQVSHAYDAMKAQIKTEEVESLAGELAKADKVFVFTAVQSSAIFSLQQNLAMGGVETGCYSLKPEMLEAARTLTKESLVIVNPIEHAETMDLLDVFQMVKKQGAKIYGFTNAKSKYRDYIDKGLLEENPGKIASGVVIFEMYFYMLSEIYRMNYLDE